MKGRCSPVYAVMPNPSMVDFPGRMAALMFTTGCNFRCGFCHNAPLLKDVKQGYAWEKLGGMCRRFRDNWVNGAVITGGEPTLAPGLPDLIAFLREFGFAVKMDTNGSRPEVLREVLPLLDYVAMDVKCSLPGYGAFVAYDRTETIQASIDLLLAGDTPCEFRTTVLPQVHTLEEMERVGALVRGAPRFVVQPFVPRDDLPDPALREEPRTPAAHLAAVGEVMERYVETVVVRGT